MLTNYASTWKKICVNRVCRFSRNTVIGNNFHFNGMYIHGDGKVTIGDNFHSGSGINLFTSYHNYDRGTKLPYDDTMYSRDIVIEKNVWLGQGVTIMAGVTIGEGCVVQAYSVVIQDVPPCSVVSGNPAKVFKTRDIRHYKDLNDKGLFF